MRIRRSLAFAKSFEPEKLQTLIDGSTDCIVLDLEDGVVVTQKETARITTLNVLQELDFKGKERIVRINAPGTPYYEADMQAILQGKPDALRLPKCETSDYVLLVANRLEQFEKENNLPENSIEIILMIESPLGIMNTYAMATCCKRVTAVGIGMEDLTASMGIVRRYELNNIDLIYARQKMVLEAKAAKVQAIDSGVLFQASKEYIYKESLIARQMGFSGRSCSSRYPELIDSVNLAFTPSDDEVSWAKRVVTAYADAVKEGRSEVYVDNKFVDPPVVISAQNLLEMMQQIASKSNP